MKLDDYLSNKFKWLSFFATWAVVGLHSRTLRWGEVSDWTDKVQIEICKGFFWAVPLFFVASGFLFVSSYEKYGWSGLLKRKFWSLYLPCVCWMILSELLVLPVSAYLHDLPSLSSFLYAPILMFEKFSISFHLWYLRALILAFLAAPVFYWLTKSRIIGWGIFLVGLGVTGLCAVPTFHLGLCHFQYVSMIPFLLLGMCLARTEMTHHKFSFLFFVASLICVILLWHRPRYVIFFRMAFLCVWWFGYDCIARGHVYKYPVVIPSVFFVYCIHTSVIKYISGCGRLIFGTEPWAKMTFFCLHFFSFWLCLLVAYVLRKYFFRFYSLMSGGR